MKHTPASNRAQGLLPALLLALACLLCVLLSPAAFGQEAAASAPAVTAPWWSGAEVISAVIALATGLIAVWQHKEKKTAQKVSESLVLAIEAATKIPAVADKEKAIKAKIRETVTDLGVQPVVHRLVKDLT